MSDVQERERSIDIPAERGLPRATMSSSEPLRDQTSNTPAEFSTISRPRSSFDASTIGYLAA